MANAGTIADAYVQILPSFEGIQGNLQEGMGKAGIGAGKKFGASLISGAKLVTAAGAAAIGKIVSNSVGAGSELEQNLGGSEAVFGEYASNIQDIADKAYKNMGVSASDYMATANKMASLFKGSGLEAKEAMDLTTQAMQRAADVASVMGIDTESAMESIAGAAKGNFTMMDNLGVAMNATTLEAYALSQGMDDFSYSTATNAEKAELAMKMFMDKTENMAGNFARESTETISGSLGAMKSAYTNFLGNLALGKDIAPSLTELTKSFKVYLVDNLFPMIILILSGLMPATGQVLSELATSIVTNLQSNLPTWVEQGGQMIMSFIQGFAEQAPMLFENIVQLIAQIVQIFIDNLPQIISTGWNIILALIKGLGDMIGELINFIFGLCGDMIGAIFETDWLQVGVDIISGVIEGIKSMAGAIWDALVGVVKDAWSGVLDFFGIASPAKEGIKAGKFIDKGLEKGLYKGASGILKATDYVSDITSRSLNSDVMFDPSIKRYAEGNSNNSSSDKGFNQTIIVNSPKELKPSEVARQTKMATQQMILDLSLGG